MTWIGVKDCAPFYRIRAQSPLDYSLCVVASGGGEVMIDGQWRPLRAGQGAVFSPGAVREFRTNSRPWQYCSVVYRLTPGSCAPPGFAKTRLIEADAGPNLALVRMVCREWLASAEQEISRGLLHVLNQYVQRLTDPRRQGRSLINLWDAVNADLARPWDVQMLADLAKMGVSTLHRVCRRELDCSPMDHVTRLRMGRASALLASDQANVTQAAATVGYDDPFAFSRAFKRVHGIAPKQFQMQQQATIARAIGAARSGNIRRFREAARGLVERPFQLTVNRGPGEFRCVPMETLFNRRLCGRGDVWLGGGKALEHFRPGRRSYHGVPFVVRNKAMVFASSRSEALCALPNRIVIPFDRRVRGVYVLHACAWAREARMIADWHVALAGGESHGREVRTFNSDSSGGTIADWWPNDPPGQSEDAMPVIVSSSDPRDAYERHLYVAQWRNPQPEKTLEHLEMRVPPGTSSVYAVLAVTLLL